VVGINNNPYIKIELTDETERLFDLAKIELHNYLHKQESDSNTDVFIGNVWDNWNSDEFNNKCRNVLPHTANLIDSISNSNVKKKFNILNEIKNTNSVLIHQDGASKPSSPWLAIENKALNKNDSVRDLLIHKDEFKLVDNVEDSNPKFESFDIDSKKVLNKKGMNTNKSVKLHFLIDDTKKLFIYDNVEDKFYIPTDDTKILLFSPYDYHGTFDGSYGISIQVAASKLNEFNY